MAMPYTLQESIPPRTPIATTTVNGDAPMQPRPDVVSAPTPILNGDSAINGTVDGRTPAKQYRLSKACDGCSVRKVKVSSDFGLHALAVSRRS